MTTMLAGDKEVSFSYDANALVLAVTWSYISDWNCRTINIRATDLKLLPLQTPSALHPSLKCAHIIGEGPERVGKREVFENFKAAQEFKVQFSCPTCNL